ncbi:MAG: bifunctional alpha,alpha-trehalose-phosphate synthase (UDP-forming)/trehalose-phosphatase [Pseudopedobacter saltans]|uniref:Bifunctional alpha,alpha-trehalose-phosphate synthase (UDP-forming)/trehalose-phosphatase n=1 Tax=Pseudopedobacter saltans TaxID=151895 RepID=A0A2W5FAB8_9SPHI|nr:MAG: bifunctional alpha,alpha-trehalose-phosphate synthase (UDP-forming)/trehalose-phosphatase [Pseudopedobacter saltans]
MGKNIIVSNRLPVKIESSESGYVFHISEGGLATGLDSVFSKGKENVWIGWPGLAVKGETDQSFISTELAKKQLKPVFLNKKEIDGFYLGFSNATLWPIFHYSPGFARYRDSEWKTYEVVNQKFASVVDSIVEDGDMVWIQDYHLLLLPLLIRNLGKKISIGFFQHIPFPSFEIFRMVPWRKELLNGMLGADLLGFHTIDDVNHFLDCSTRLLDATVNSNIVRYNKSISAVDAFPMGIDFEKFDSVLPAEPKTKKDIEILEQQFLGQKLILSIDRLDYSKGILPRLRAIELLFDEHPEYKGKVSLFMIVVPSRDTIYRYKELKDEIDKIVGNINARFRTIGWEPIHYFYQSFSPDYLSALYQMTSICLVTPMRDGMNLVSKEYVASRGNEDGVLILSEMAGASRELYDALIVNPNDIRQIAGAIVQAMNMPSSEQQSRMQKMREIVKKFDIAHWVKIFLSKLQEVKQLQDSFKTRNIEKYNTKLVRDFQKAKERVLFLDYDGTLVGFNSSIEKTFPDEELYTIIDKLSSNPQNHVVIISGRNHETLEKWFGKYPVELIGEHGVWRKYIGKDWESISGLSNEWKKDVMPVLEVIADRTPGSFIEEKSNSLVWHYRKADAELGKLRANEIFNDLSYILRNKGLQLMYGDKVVEIKNSVVSKGKALLRWLDDHSSIHNPFIMAIGDDTTDEDMFSELQDRDSITIKVGQQMSHAKYYIETYRDVRKLLKMMY